ncbi:dinuclear metal center protein, YbgI/SA1388 family [Desulfocicer vacuolatum DSM 3385]|uniref:GTP cyclohydrolase 1 type 2 homolog n=1 Tax=Desulfocicer vacuolatum DSM 3385 TaxID=1121400 RepID=A0A1W2B7Q7_9BACT|nr:Nif3-like dinuclear metal center hexameric protein [Desulfocicer vacuolatum]SMC69007.1 dinuclear metal center protein, YbgI/SA1388 family [Desulfocicer vacuolatum DSM 3385]
MTSTVYDFLGHLDGIAPFTLAESWDNCGLQAGDADGPVTRVMVALDVTMDVMNAALKWGADLVLTHHPLMIKPLARLNFNKMPGSAIAMAATHQIAIVSLHTNLDKARGGLNDRFAAILGLENLSCLQPSSHKDMSDDSLEGLGRVGNLSRVMTLEALAERVKSVFKIPHVRMVGDLNMMVKTVAVCTGSGESLLNDVFSSGAQAYITGDMKYHGARDIEMSGMGGIDVGHFASEHIAIDLLVEKVKALSVQEHLGLEVKGYIGETDPFVVK